MTGDYFLGCLTYNLSGNLDKKNLPCLRFHLPLKRIEDVDILYSLYRSL